ncbi:MAG: 50S ribosomal protein L10 [Deltaproteobacteria bacterium]|nr:50S ribosomal protein L10 [Deltaproteobacteria bacterium]
MNRTDKAAIIEHLATKSQKAVIAAVADFKGMQVEEMIRLRGKLREAGGELVIVKNTLARIAFTDGKHDCIKDMFRENCAVALGYEDPVAIAKAFTDFARTSKKLVVKHGSLEGKVLSAAQLDALAKLPGRQELLAQTLGTMNAVPTNFVSLFANMIRSMLYALKAVEEKKAA